MFKAVCVCLDKRRNDITIDQELKDYNIYVDKFWVGDGTHPVPYSHVDVPIDGPRPQAYNFAICLKKIIQQAKDEGIETLLFLEDDAALRHNFGLIFPLLSFQVSKLYLCKPQWDMVYLGGHSPECEKPVIKQVMQHLYQSNYILDLHATIFHQRSFDKVLDIPIDGTETIDGKIAGLTRQGVFTCLMVNPPIVAQKAGWSYNEGQKPLNRGTCTI